MVFFRTRELALLFVLVLATSAFAHKRHVYNILGTPYLDREKAIFPPAPEPANRSNTRALIISTLALAATLALLLRRTV